MSEAQKIRNRADRELEELRRVCPHKNLSDWMDEEWAIAHTTGFAVQICARCEKVIHRKTCCNECAKPIADDEIYMGIGTAQLPGGGRYCKSCFDKAEPETELGREEFAHRMKVYNARTKR